MNLHTMRENISELRASIRVVVLSENAKAIINIRAARDDKFWIILKRTRRSSSFVAVVRTSKQEKMRAWQLYLGCLHNSGGTSAE